MLSDSIEIFEVGPRDGLQNEPQHLTVDQRVSFVGKLLEAGLRKIEVGAFVRSDRVPQMNHSEEVIKLLQPQLAKYKGAEFWCLVPNLKGLERSNLAQNKFIAIFTAATDGFAKKNIGMTVDESLTEFKKIVDEAKPKGLRVRGYVSTAFGCPYEGKVAPAKAVRVIEALYKMGVEQISVGDTIGVATPNQVSELLDLASPVVPLEKLAVHFHDTRGTALANALIAYQKGIRVFDSSAGGLGGCPYAPGASGNLATEDLVYMFSGMGVKTNVDLEKLAKTSLELNQLLKRPFSSRYLTAFAATCTP